MAAEAGGSGPSRGSDRPSLGRHAQRGLVVPEAWPEAVAWRAGGRLFHAEDDDIPTMMRQGLSVDHHLEQIEVEARFTLGTGTFERWFRLGWSRAADDEEE